MKGKKGKPGMTVTSAIFVTDFPRMLRDEEERKIIQFSISSAQDCGGFLSNFRRSVPEIIVYFLLNHVLKNSHPFLLRSIGNVFHL